MLLNTYKKIQNLSLKYKILLFAGIALAIFSILFIFLIILVLIFGQTNTSGEIKAGNNFENSNLINNHEINTIDRNISTTTAKDLYTVVRVVDGDTLDVELNGKIQRLRLIGINTPETVDPRKTVECFGKEASDKAKEILTGKKVRLENDPTQGETDKYGRFLRYVFLEDSTNFNLYMIKAGYAYEYTYNIPYKYQTEFKQAQKEAEIGKVGLWGVACNATEFVKTSTSTTSIVVPKPTASTNISNQTLSTSCNIKGNISSSGEKIYHMIGCGSYTKTVINESAGERWFCSEQEALSAGWRKALNCN